MPDEKWGERPKAYVELKGDAELSEEELISFAGEPRPLQVPGGDRVR